MKKFSLEQLVESALHEDFDDDWEEEFEEAQTRDLKRSLGLGGLSVGLLLSSGSIVGGPLIAAIAAIYLGGSYGSQAAKYLGPKVSSSIKDILKNMEKLPPKVSQEIKKKAKELKSKGIKESRREIRFSSNKLLKESKNTLTESSINSVERLANTILDIVNNDISETLQDVIDQMDPENIDLEYTEKQLKTAKELANKLANTLNDII